MPTRPTKLTGAAGEYFVAYVLSRFGYPVALTRDGSDVIDLMAGSISTGLAKSIQVKTAANARKAKYWEWSVGRKPLELSGSSLVYIFIDLKEGSSRIELPDAFVVPLADIAAQAVTSGFAEHPKWNTFYFKIHDEDESKYKEAWGLITNELNG